MDAENTAVLPFEQRFRTCFGNMLVCKTPANAKLFAELNLPSFIRDWLIMRFSDQNGAIDQKKADGVYQKDHSRQDAVEQHAGGHALSQPNRAVSRQGQNRF